MRIAYRASIQCRWKFRYEDASQIRFFADGHYRITQPRHHEASEVFRTWLHRLKPTLSVFYLPNLMALLKEIQRMHAVNMRFLPEAYVRMNFHRKENRTSHICFCVIRVEYVCSAHCVLYHAFTPIDTQMSSALSTDYDHSSATTGRFRLSQSSALWYPLHTVHVRWDSRDWTVR